MNFKIFIQVATRNIFLLTLANPKSNIMSLKKYFICFTMCIVSLESESITEGQYRAEDLHVFWEGFAGAFACICYFV